MLTAGRFYSVGVGAMMEHDGYSESSGGRSSAGDLPEGQGGDPEVAATSEDADRQLRERIGEIMAREAERGMAHSSPPPPSYFLGVTKQRRFRTIPGPRSSRDRNNRDG